ncbi:hypothetical protein BDY21DRAFT_106561 [Lineolata rhizophorae]|uniref:Uncharacterized protein n=1 Tax=Lineolata rhizophorae TaxID=578093 RepID=A0A6A6NSF5_9PEZI|nr:hypothetical protein BDY21DRAFT_106561 [Lineolata rhizophorae]
MCVRCRVRWRWRASKRAAFSRRAIRQWKTWAGCRRNVTLCRGKLLWGEKKKEKKRNYEPTGLEIPHARTTPEHAKGGIGRATVTGNGMVGTGNLRVRHSGESEMRDAGWTLVASPSWGAKNENPGKRPRYAVGSIRIVSWIPLSSELLPKRLPCLLAPGQPA